MRREVPQKHLSHAKINSTPEASFSFQLKSVYDLLPTPANKSKWFGREEMCTLCGGHGTLSHILTGCPVALSQGRYKWRHDKVLKELSSCIDKQLVENSKSTSLPTNRRVIFVREGEKNTQNSNEPDNYLTSAKDWKMSLD